MADDFVPDDELLMSAWAANLLARIAADPGAVGVPVAMLDEAVAMQAAFADALHLARTPGTRTRPAIERKNDLKRSLERVMRRIARLINAQPGLGNDERITLGLTPRTTAAVASIGPQDRPPTVHIRSEPRRVIVTLCPIGGHARTGRPRGTRGALVMFSADPTPPADISQWRLAALTTRRTVSFAPPLDIPAGTVIHVTACWLSPTLQQGPMSSPQRTRVLDGLSAPASRKLAA